MSIGEDFLLTLFTNDPGLAARADAGGIQRIGLDLERLGKNERQGSMNTWISDHDPSHLPHIRAQLQRADLFVRTNPPHTGLGAEIDAYLAEGARVLMLPMFAAACEAKRFVDLVAGRARVVLLVETPAAAARLHQIVKVPGVDEIHFGLNDLRLGMKLRSHFELLSSDLVDCMARTVREAGIPLGVGGVGRLGDLALPIPSDLVYAQFPRLGATRALVSRVFFAPDPAAINVGAEVARLRARLDHWERQPVAALHGARDQLRTMLAC